MNEAERIFDSQGVLGFDAGIYNPSGNSIGD